MRAWTSRPPEQIALSDLACERRGLSAISTVQRFACTQCGKCCNRAPEVELSEAAPLADMFVFRLMFRLYWLPNRMSDSADAGSSAAFFEKKRLLGAFAAHKASVKVRRNGKAVDSTRYLVVSALALDTGQGTCPALDGTRCSIHDRRPLSCRSVPLHYSRPQALAAADLAAFVATAGYECDTGDSADAVVTGGIIEPAYAAARADALALAERDRPWAEAIVREMKAGRTGLPAMQQIEDNACFAATTIPMRAAWQVAADIGLISRDECDRLVELQLEVIDRELMAGGCSDECRQTLFEMRAEYVRVN